MLFHFYFITSQPTIRSLPATHHGEVCDLSKSFLICPSSVGNYRSPLVYKFFRNVYFFFMGRVDVPFTRYAPHRSGRAAFPHPALHMANRMSDLCVSDTFLLEISFLVMPISVYWASFFLGYCHM